MYREFKRRQSVQLGAFYSRKLAALEDALLATREALFALQEDGSGGGGAIAAPLPPAAVERQQGAVGRKDQDTKGDGDGGAGLSHAERVRAARECRFLL
jgi:hypothetical protein